MMIKSILLMEYHLDYGLSQCRPEIQVNTDYIVKGKTSGGRHLYELIFSPTNESSTGLLKLKANVKSDLAGLLRACPTTTH